MRTDNDARVERIREHTSTSHCEDYPSVTVQDINFLLAEVDRLRALHAMTDDALRGRLAVAIHANDRAAIIEIVGALSNRLTAAMDELNAKPRIQFECRLHPENSLPAFAAYLAGEEVEEYPTILVNFASIFHSCADPSFDYSTGEWQEIIADSVVHELLHLVQHEFGRVFSELEVEGSIQRARVSFDGRDQSALESVPTEHEDALMTFHYDEAARIEADKLRLADELDALRAAYTWTPATPETMPPLGSGPWLVTHKDWIGEMWSFADDDGPYWAESAANDGLGGLIENTMFAAVPIDAPAPAEPEVAP